MDEQGGIFGVGYEGRDLDAVLKELDAMGADVLVDVRLNPISRKRGLSKTALSEALEHAGIEYRHLKALGNPRENRAGFAETSGPAALDARVEYSRLLAMPEAAAALDTLTELARTQRVAVLCYEASELQCHRREVLNVIRARLG